MAKEIGPRMAVAPWRAAYCWAAQGAPVWAREIFFKRAFCSYKRRHEVK